jgi:cell wall-associated NlpC family hydrolase
MKYVVCIVAVAPLRKEASHRTEIVSELLLGEFAELLESNGDFMLVRCLYDGYEGWCQRTQLTESLLPVETKHFTRDPIQQITVNLQPCRVSCATPVYLPEEVLQYGKFKLLYKGTESIDASTFQFIPSNIKLITQLYLNTPYLWGGKSVFGIDCSGFTQQVFKLFAIKMQRDAWQQAEAGEAVGFLQEVQCGDLAFFDNAEGRITHVGILLNSEEIIHASGKVRIDKIDNAGIINSDTGERTHSLRLLKRYKK